MPAHGYTSGFTDDLQGVQQARRSSKYSRRAMIDEEPEHESEKTEEEKQAASGWTEMGSTTCTKVINRKHKYSSKKSQGSSYNESVDVFENQINNIDTTRLIHPYAHKLSGWDCAKRKTLETVE